MSIFSHPVASLIVSITSSVHQCNPPLSSLLPLPPVITHPAFLQHASKQPMLNVEKVNVKKKKTIAQWGSAPFDHLIFHYFLRFKCVCFFLFASAMVYCILRDYRRHVIWHNDRFQASRWKPLIQRDNTTFKGIANSYDNVLVQTH